MPMTQVLRRVCCAVVAACSLLLCGIATAWAQGLTVSAITVGGKAA